MSSGRFIVFEGGEGTGKSTQIRHLESRLLQSGRDVVVTWEPGGTPLGSRIREVLLDPASGAVDPRCEALLYAASRAEHVAKVIRPAIQRGAIVLCDRYWDASRAYQGAGRGLGVASIDAVNIWGTEGLLPDRVYLFDIDPAAGLKRVQARTPDGSLDRLEQESLDFHRRIRAAYLHLASLDAARYRVFDASRGVDEITAALMEDVNAFLTAPL